MNKLFFLLVFVLLPFQMKGQSVCFIEPDKVWHVKGQTFYNPSNLPLDRDYYFTAESDTLIDGMHYMRLFELYNNKVKMAGIFREEEGVVYRYYPQLQREYVFYDFTLKPGETITIMENGRYPTKCEAKAVEIQTLKDGTKVHKIQLASTMIDEMGEDYVAKDTWIEGIGNIIHPLLHVWAGEIDGVSYAVAYVKCGNEVIYSNTASDVESIKATEDSRAYDLMGRPVTKGTKQKVIIQNGRKVWRK